MYAAMILKIYISNLKTSFYKTMSHLEPPPESHYQIISGRPLSRMRFFNSNLFVSVHNNRIKYTGLIFHMELQKKVTISILLY